MLRTIYSLRIAGWRLTLIIYAVLQDTYNRNS